MHTLQARGMKRADANALCPRWIGCEGGERKKDPSISGLYRGGVAQAHKRSHHPLLLALPANVHQRTDGDEQRAKIEGRWTKLEGRSAMDRGRWT
jgi:hypothetical protein